MRMHLSLLLDLLAGRIPVVWWSCLKCSIHQHHDITNHTTSWVGKCKSYVKGVCHGIHVDSSIRDHFEFWFRGGWMWTCYSCVSQSRNQIYFIKQGCTGQLRWADPKMVYHENISNRHIIISGFINLIIMSIGCSEKKGKLFWHPSAYASLIHFINTLINLLSITSMHT